MLKVKVRIFDNVEKREGVHETRGPWTMVEQLAQIEGGESLPSYPYAIRLKDESEKYEPGFYIVELHPRQGRFRNTLEWQFDNYKKAA